MVHLTRGAHVRLTLGIDYILKTPASSSTRSRHLTIRTNLFFLISIRRGKSTIGCPYLFLSSFISNPLFFYPPLGYIQFGSAQALQPELPRNSKLSFPFFGDFPLNLTRSENDVTLLLFSVCVLSVYKQCWTDAPPGRQVFRVADAHF